MLKDGRQIYLTVPSRDGFEGAAFDVKVSARDVLKQAQGKLREVPAGGKRRLHMLFDRHGWTKRNGMVRWMLRTPDLCEDHNSPLYGRDVMPYLGDDKHAWLDTAVDMGGDNSMRKQVRAGTRVLPRPLPPVMELDDEMCAAQSINYAEALKELLRVELKTELTVPMGEGEADVECELGQGGDMSAAHSGYGIDTPVMKEGCCFRCMLGKGDWFDITKCRKSVRRTYIYQMAANHCDPWSRLPGCEGRAPVTCPHCGKKITPELEAAEKKEMSDLSEGQRKVAMRTHSVLHRGAQQGKQVVLTMEFKARARSALHRRTNGCAYNLTATFMAVRGKTWAATVRMRERANVVLEKYNLFWRFPVRKTGRTPPVEGNDARALHSNPGLLKELFDIFYPGGGDTAPVERAAEQAARVMPNPPSARQAAHSSAPPGRRAARATRR